MAPKFERSDHLAISSAQPGVSVQEIDGLGSDPESDMFP
jgi:hypothetical protein